MSRGSSLQRVIDRVEMGHADDFEMILTAGVVNSPNVAVIGQRGVGTVSGQLKKVVLAAAGVDVEVGDGVEAGILLIHEGIVAGAAEQPVVAALAVERLGAARADDPVVE